MLVAYVLKACGIPEQQSLYRCSDHVGRTLITGRRQTSGSVRPWKLWGAHIACMDLADFNFCAPAEEAERLSRKARSGGDVPAPGISWGQRLHTAIRRRLRG